ncbi:MAG: (d)CMP kinase [Bacteroidales bacterium]|nr:(d)CMP kinase [Candidatus Hennigimonas equi]
MLIKVCDDMGIISITGALGSGKSTVAKNICAKTGFSYFSTGTIQRKIAEERGIDTLQLNQLCGSDKSVDDLIDGRLRQMNVDGTTDIVLDSRLAWFFVGNSFKVYLTALPSVAADRVFHDDKRVGEPTGDQLEVMGNLLERQRIENERFKRFYNADCFDLNNFDIVVDSSKSTVDDIADLIISEFDASLKTGSYTPTRWISPLLPLPAEGCSADGPVALSFTGDAYFVHSGLDILREAVANGISLIKYTLL